MINSKSMFVCITRFYRLSKILHSNFMFSFHKLYNFLRYDLWFGGEPAPTCEWIKDGRTLTPNEDMSIELYSKNSIYTERNTVLSIPKVINGSH